VNLVDANVLLYAVNEDAPRHETARRWLDDALSGGSPVAFSWLVVLAFARLSTKVGLFPAPLSVSGAMDRVDAWLSASPSVVVEPTTDHARVLRRLLAPLGTGGNIVSDAHLAALAVEHRCTVVTYDSGFMRFDGVRSTTPDRLLGAGSSDKGR
jgi:toxin-antitoxin system PIN domain toxin